MMQGYRRGQRHIKNLRLYAILRQGVTYWRLRTPDPSGRGFKDRQFSNEAEAQTAFEAALIQHQNHGLAASQLSAKQRGDALHAIEILRPLGMSLSEAAKLCLRHHANVYEGKLVSEAVTELLKAKAKDGLSPLYHKDLRMRLARFVAEFGTRKIAELGVDEVEEWLRGLNVGPSTRNTFQLRLSVLFEFARRRHWCAENPMLQVEKAKWKGVEPGVLSPQQFAKLLQVADHETRPYWLIGGWCGLRSAELERLEWQDIDFERQLVEVSTAKAKTAARRHVTIRPALKSWLAPYRGCVGPVCPVNLRQRLEADRERAAIKNWPFNGLRHSFASYALEHFQQPGQLCVEMGHVDQGLVARHYRRRVSPEAAKAWWSIYPPSAMQHIIVEGQFKAAS
jgi:integrase